MPFHILEKDITKVHAGAIVDPANPYPTYGGGTDAAIYKAAGAQKLLEERKMIGNIRPGNCAATHAFDLDADYIIHTVGPSWEGGNAGELDILAGCYRNSLECARLLQCRSIAFPLIGTGVYGFPKDKALQTALAQITDFLSAPEKDHRMNVKLVVFDRENFEMPAALMKDLDAYLAENFVPERPLEEEEEPYEEEDEPKKKSFFSLFGRKKKKEALEEQAPAEEAGSARLSDYVRARGENLGPMVSRFAGEKSIAMDELERRSNLAPARFRRILSGEEAPEKKDVLELSLGLRLTVQEASSLLSAAGYRYSASDVTDVITWYCLTHHLYNCVQAEALYFVRADYGMQ